jgi:hypothetical protein
MIAKRSHIMRWILVCTLALAGVLGLTEPIFAGQPCPEKPAEPKDTVKNLQLATKVRERLEASGATVAFVGRAGIDLREFGLIYSHVGFAWRDHPRGRWFTFHLLNPCGEGRSELTDQSLEDFYNVELFTYDAIMVLPSKENQLKLLKTFFSPLAPSLHHIDYNMISNPWSTKYQNSNQWVLEVTAAALAPENTVNNRAQAQLWLKQAGFVPSKTVIGAMRRLGSRMFSPHVFFDDRDGDERMSGVYNTVTVESIIAFITLQDRAMTQETVHMDRR